MHYCIENATDRWEIEWAFCNHFQEKMFLFICKKKKKNQTFHPVHVKEWDLLFMFYSNHRGIFTLLAVSLSLQLSKNLRIIWIQWLNFQKFSFCSDNTLELVYKKVLIYCYLAKFLGSRTEIYLECFWSFVMYANSSQPKLWCYCCINSK